MKEVSDQLAVKRPNPYGSSTTWVSLKAQEDTEKSKWAARLQKIATKAGAAAKINGPARDGLSAKEDEAIKAIVSQVRCLSHHEAECESMGEVRPMGNRGRGWDLSPNRCRGGQVCSTSRNLGLRAFGDPSVLLLSGVGVQKARNGCSGTNVPRGQRRHRQGLY